MSKTVRFGSAMSLIALASVMGGCATPSSQFGSASGFGGKANGEIGLATRAMAALNSNNVPMAIDFAERAVEKTPNDAGFRALLGSAYFAGGRFKSAESAYKDSLALYSNQPQVVLKLALVEIALGKNNDALAFLEAGRDVLDPADYGLAVALAGRPQDAVQVLETAARGADADARVRQNLALAYALSGDWTNARTVAAQDVPSDQLDARIQQWMQMATPGHQSNAVASLIGVTPAAVDQGQPVQLALRKTDTQMALVTPVPTPAPAPAPVQAPAPLPPQMAEVAPVAVPQVSEAPAPVQPVQAQTRPVMVAEAEPAPPPMPFVNVPKRSAKTATKTAALQRASAPAAKPPMRTAALTRGSSSAVVQLGAYSNEKSVLTAWNRAAKHYRALQAYAPMSARYASPQGIFYRLSVKGFGSVNEAAALCSSVRRSGGSCFVRNVAGDTPVEIASR